MAFSSFGSFLSRCGENLYGVAIVVVVVVVVINRHTYTHTHTHTHTPDEGVGGVVHSGGAPVGWVFRGAEGWRLL